MSRYANYNIGRCPVCDSALVRVPVHTFVGFKDGEPDPDYDFAPYPVIGEEAECGFCLSRWKVEWLGEPPSDFRPMTMIERETIVSTIENMLARDGADLSLSAVIAELGLTADRAELLTFYTEGSSSSLAEFASTFRESQALLAARRMPGAGRAWTSGYNGGS